MPIISARDTTNNKNRVITMDGDKLLVKDSGVATALGGTLTVDASGYTVPVSGTFFQATQPISAASLPLPSGAATDSNQSTANGHLGDLAGCVNSAGSQLDVKIATDAAGLALASGQTTANNHLSSIDSALAGTISVSSGVSRTSGSLKSGVAVTSGDTTSAIDANNYNKIVVYGESSDNAQQLILQVSDDSTNWYDSDSFIYANSSNGHYYYAFDACARYYRIKYNSSATETTKYSMLA